MEVKLKPCPFCGGEAQLNNTENIASVRCRFCGAATRLIVRYPMDERNHVEMAVNGWNRRWKSEITECPMCPDCPDGCPLEVEHE